MEKQVTIDLETLEITAHLSSFSGLLLIIFQPGNELIEF